MFPNTLLLLLGIAAAAPFEIWPKYGPKDSKISSITIDLNGLPPPNINSSSPLQLRYISLGIGYQNYSCSSNSSAAPSSIGAVASLYDIKDLLEEAPGLRSYITPPALYLSHLSTHVVPAGFKTPASTKSNRHKPPGNYPYPTFKVPLPIEPIGEHFFSTPSNLPTFNLHDASPPARIEAKKLASKAAPGTAAKGLDGQSAIDWLALSSSGSQSNSGGLQMVYRVETAGGKAPATCQGVVNGGTIMVPYAAEYWFYGEAVEGGDESEDEDAHDDNEDD